MIREKEATVFDILRQLRLKNKLRDRSRCDALYNLRWCKNRLRDKCRRIIREKKRGRLGKSCNSRSIILSESEGSIQREHTHEIDAKSRNEVRRVKATQPAHKRVGLYRHRSEHKFVGEKTRSKAERTNTSLRIYYIAGGGSPQTDTVPKCPAEDPLQGLRQTPVMEGEKERGVVRRPPDHSLKDRQQGAGVRAPPYPPQTLYYVSQFAAFGNETPGVKAARKPRLKNNTQKTMGRDKFQCYSTKLSSSRSRFFSW